MLAFRTRGGQIEVLLVHPGGPYWRNKDLGAWSIPKGEFASDEAAELAARREFGEELGIKLSLPLSPLGEVRQRGGKIVEAFAVEFDVDVQRSEATRSRSNGRHEAERDKHSPRSIAPNGST